VDASKDQSYALWGLTQESLSRTLFPLGDLTKPETRAIGERLGLPVAGKPESYEICFIPDNDYARFLKERIPTLGRTVAGGAMVRNGDVVGRHDGYPFYTIGQRRGLGVAMGEPVYVTGIDAAANRVTLGTERDLMSSALIARDVNLIRDAAIEAGMRVHAKIRYRDEGGPAALTPAPDGRLEVRFDAPRRAVTPGQSVVFYDGDDVVGGGIIDAALA
jgi:tRNA-specific 2-thiouridylase